MNKILSLLGFDSAKHSVRVEMIAGLTTFLTMSYILAVNPLILGEAGMDKGAVCVEGVVFILLTIFKAREAIVNAIPLNLRPLFLIIPPAANTSALVLVGVMMMRPITQIDFDDITEVVPGFITIVMMPFTASISEGIFLGMLSYVLVKVLSGRYREVSLFMYILALFFLLKYVAPLLH